MSDAALKLWHTYTDARCRWEGRTYRAATTHELARRLLRHGCPDQPFVVYAEADRQVCLAGRSLRLWAERGTGF